MLIPFWNVKLTGHKKKGELRFFRQPQKSSTQETRVAPIAIFFGVLLSILGGVLFALAEVKSSTALFPTYFGVALIILGFVARNEKARKHAMHFAAMLGLIGLVGGVAMGIKALIGERPATVWAGSFGMAALCGVFLVLCIRSFIAARRAREQRGSALS
jgi:uncharacterized membrane protein HdeD (DUF308 family)